MKNSINTDIFLLNIYSLTNLSPFFNGKSINQNFFTCAYLSVVAKISLPFWAGKHPLGVEMNKRLWGLPGPSGMGTVQPENQGGLVPSGTTADVEHRAGLGAAAGWPFLPGASACGITAQRVNKGGRNMLIPAQTPLSPRGAQILLTHQSNHVTLDLRAYWTQGIQSQPEPVRKLSAEQGSWLEAKADKEEPSSSDISAWRNMLNRPCT